jgi:hypothetical protein
MSVLESIVRDLQDLPPQKLVEVARYIQTLNASDREKRDAALRATAGCMAGPDGEEFEREVKAEGERIDVDAW